MVERLTKVLFQVPPATQIEVPLPSTRFPTPGEGGNPEPTFPNLPVVDRGGRIGRHQLQFVSWEDYQPSRDEDLSQGGHVYHDNGNSQWGNVDKDDRDHYGRGYGDGDSDKSS